MQPLRLNTERSYWTPVKVIYTDEEGKSQKGSFRAKFRIANHDETSAVENEDKTLLDLVLLDVEHLELCDNSGSLLTGEALLHAAKVDPLLGNAMVLAYGASVQKKPRS